MKVTRPKHATKVLLAAGLAGCVSRFELELPREHPAETTAPTSGPLVIPDPSEMRAPPPDMGEDGHHGDGMHEKHSAPVEHGADAEHGPLDGDVPRDGGDH